MRRLTAKKIEGALFQIACARFIHADAEDQPLWLADGGWYD